VIKSDETHFNRIVKICQRLLNNREEFMSKALLVIINNDSSGATIFSDGLRYLFMEFQERTYFDKSFDKKR